MKSIKIMATPPKSQPSALEGGEQKPWPHGTYPMLRNSASGPEVKLPGLISARLDSGKPQNRTSGRPKADPAEILPRSPISGPESLLGNMGA